MVVFLSLGGECLIGGLEGDWRIEDFLHETPGGRFSMQFKESKEVL